MTTCCFKQAFLILVNTFFETKSDENVTIVVVVVVDIISPNVGTPRLRVEQFGV